MSNFYLYWWWSGNLLKYLKENISVNKIRKVVILYHAKEFHKWNKSFLEDYDNFKKEIFLWAQIKIGSYNLNELITQINEADIIIIKWWSSLILKENLFPIKDKLHDLLQNKIIVWISAWAYILSEKFYSNDRNVIDTGFGILPWTFLICHYTPDLERNFNNTRELLGLKVIRLAEYEWCLIST